VSCIEQEIIATVMKTKQPR